MESGGRIHTPAFVQKLSFKFSFVLMTNEENSLLGKIFYTIHCTLGPPIICTSIQGVYKAYGTKKMEC